MPTLTAPASARAAAAKRGLAPAAAPASNRESAQVDHFRSSSQLENLPAPAPPAPARSKRQVVDLITSAPAPATSGQAEPKPPSRKLQKSIEHHARQMAARERVYETLRTVFPMAFGTLPPLPLKIKIHEDVLAVATGEIDAADLSAFLRYWCSRRSYLIAVWRGMGRRDLNGAVVGVPTLDQRNDAGRSVWGPRYRPIEEAAEVAETKSC